MKSILLVAVVLLMGSKCLTQNLKFASITFNINGTTMATQPTRGTIQIDEVTGKIVVETERKSTVYKILDVTRTESEATFRVMTKDVASGEKQNSTIVYDSFFNLFKIINEVRGIRGIESYNLAAN